jgi:hypothetical protein
MLGSYGYKHALRMNHTYCFSTTTRVARTRHNVPYIACLVVSNNKSTFHFVTFKTCLDFALVHWVQQARVGSQGGRSGHDKQFVSSCDKRQRLLQHTSLIKGRVTRPAILRRCLQLLSREVAHHRAPSGRLPFRLHQRSQTPFHHFSLYGPVPQIQNVAQLTDEPYLDTKYSSSRAVRLKNICYHWMVTSSTRQQVFFFLCNSSRSGTLYYKPINVHRQPQQTASVPSKPATCFGNTDDPQALNT